MAFGLLQLSRRLGIDWQDHMRLMLEQKFYGPKMVNVVVCEGTERVQRTESFKQWQIRTVKARFTQLPLDPELMKKAREKVDSQ
ncbi:hypothetical protein V6N13_052084 [Hibiscus sabdariffa]